MRVSVHTLCSNDQVYTTYLYMYGHVHSKYELTYHVHLLTDANAMLLPRRVPGYKITDVKLLPSSTTKKSMWELYLQAAAASLMRAVRYLTFPSLWRRQLLNIMVMKLMSDLCWVCQHNSVPITRSTTEAKKSRVSH